MKSIPNCVPQVAGNEIKYLKECIDTGWISPVGPFVDRLEKVFADYHGFKTATAVSSGTAAIHLGLISLGVKPGDLVLCPTINFIGSVNPIRYCGAEPVFLGVDPKTLNIDTDCLLNFLQKETVIKDGNPVYKVTGQRIAALIVVQLYGNPADMDEIIDLALEYKFPVLEDAAESLGARYKGKLTGTIGNVGCFSFNGNKVITSGGGGMVISKDEEITKHCKHLSTQAKVDSFEFKFDNVGYNYRLSNLCAAVGLAQFEHLDEFIQKKREHADAYRKMFKKDGIWEIIDPPEGCYGTYWMVLVRINEKGSKSLINELRLLSQEGLGVRPIWYPIHMLPLYKDSIYYGVDNYEELYHSVICLPSSVGLTNVEIEYVVEELNNIDNKSNEKLCVK